MYIVLYISFIHIYKHISNDMYSLVPLIWATAAAVAFACCSCIWGEYRPATAAAAAAAAAATTILWLFINVDGTDALPRLGTHRMSSSFSSSIRFIAIDGLHDGELSNSFSSSSMPSYKAHKYINTLNSTIKRQCYCIYDISIATLNNSENICHHATKSGRNFQF